MPFGFKKLKTKLVKELLGELLEQLTPDVLREIADAVLDIIENAVARSDTQIDDRIVLPIIRMIRIALEIPDNDD